MIKPITTFTRIDNSIMEVNLLSGFGRMRTRAQVKLTRVFPFRSPGWLLEELAHGITKSELNHAVRNGAESSQLKFARCALKLRGRMSTCFVWPRSSQRRSLS